MGGLGENPSDRKEPGPPVFPKKWPIVLVRAIGRHWRFVSDDLPSFCASFAFFFLRLISPWVVAPHTILLAQSCPDVDEIEVFDYRGLAKPEWLKKHSGCRAWWKEARELWNRRNGYQPDLAFCVREDTDPVQVASHIVMATSRARWKVGDELSPHLGPLSSARLLDVAAPRKQQGHEGGTAASPSSPRVAGPPLRILLCNIGPLRKRKPKRKNGTGH